MTLRWRSKDSSLRRYLSDQAFVVRELSDAPLMSEAENIYLRAKGQGRPGTFAQAVARAIGNLIGTVGDKPIDRYPRQDAIRVRDALFERDLSKASVKRMFGTIRALVNFVTRELGLSDVFIVFFRRCLLSWPSLSLLVFLNRKPFQKRQLRNNKKKGQAHKAKYLEINPEISGLCTPYYFI